MKRLFRTLLAAVLFCWPAQAFGQDVGPHPHFMTLPYLDPLVALRQGWYYDSTGSHSCPDAPPGLEDRCHKGIDYFLGRPGERESFSIVAVASGKAIASTAKEGGGGDFVCVLHDEVGEDGTRWISTYRHVRRDSLKVPYVDRQTFLAHIASQNFQAWKRVARGDELASAGDSGTSVIHLHLETSKNAYAVNKVDPYGIYKSYEYYPYPCGDNYLWTSCPPVLRTEYDDLPPSIPAGFSITSTSTSAIAFGWQDSTDNVGVTGYKVSRDGMPVGEVVQPSYQESGLTADTTYCYTVLAFDAAGNESSQSPSVCVMTLVEAPTGPFVLQPGPGEGKDIWTTSVYSYAPGGGGPGGGRDDYMLKVGGWGDYYYSLLELDLTGMPLTAATAYLELYPFQSAGTYGSTSMYFDRITSYWDWRTQGTGSDFLRLWWIDRPAASQWFATALPAAIPGEWYRVDITNLYNAWQNGTHSNFGVQLRPTNVSNRWNHFYSSDYLGDLSLRPRLVVTAASTTQPAVNLTFDEDVQTEQQYFSNVWKVIRTLGHTFASDNPLSPGFDGMFTTPTSAMISNGTRFLGNYGGRSIIKMTNTQGQVFSLLGFDVAPPFPDSAPASSNNATELRVSGITANGESLVETISLVPNQFRHFDLPSTWTDVVSVTFSGWAPTCSSTGCWEFLLDNIRVQ